MIKTYTQLFFLLLLLSVLSMSVGVSEVYFYELLDISSNTWLILLSSRIPRLLTLIMVGASLSICGVILQHIVRNRFIEPGTIGGFESAKLGILVSLTLLPLTNTTHKMFFAILFCFIASLIYIIIISKIKFRSTVVIPIIGLMYGSVVSAITEFYAYRNNILQSMQGWLLGDFSKVIQGHYEVIYLILPIVILTYLYAHRFTVIGMGRDVATSLGLNYTIHLILGLFVVSITVSVTIIIVGAIPFVGLVVPNLVAKFYGENLKRTLSIVAMGGALIVLVCDIIGRLLIYPFEVPIGLTVGGIGGIIFLILIVRGVR